ncbi:MAG: methyltransferase domain-containing protein [Acidobacteria bacterium]|nr:methyltransferase domain-containing protein [Acidobacteriota bacterium]
MDTAYGQAYATGYATHWWWRAREIVIESALRELELPRGASILDFGCGDAVSFPMLERFGRVDGIEVDETLLSPAGPYRDRISSAALGSPAYRDRQYQLITALDVIEHIEDDSGTVGQLEELAAPGGWLVVTVPASMRLWSSHDVVNHHYRRYERAQLQRLLSAHFEVVDVRYLFQLLFVPKYLLARLERLMGGEREAAISQTSLPAPPLNWAMRRGLVLESKMLRHLNPPFGTTLLAVVRKRR